MSAFGNDTQVQRLAEALKRLRVAAGLTGYQVAEALGVDQSTVSRIERGQQKRVSLSQVTLWAKAANASPERLEELLALAEDILVGPKSWDDIAPGTTNFQRQTAELEARTGVLSIYMPASIPGLLQTAAYARRVFTSAGPLPDVTERVLGRIERQRILYDDSKRFRFVIPEAVLRWPFGPADDPAVLNEHRDQLARLGEVMTRPNVELGILPLRPSSSWRLSGFVVYDEVADGDPQVHLEWLTRPYNIFEPEQVEACRQVFGNLMAESVTDESARRLLTDAAAGLG